MLLANLFVKVLFDVVDKNTGDSVIIVLWSSGSTHHLQYIRDGHIDVATGLAIIVFRSFDDHQMCGKVNTPIKEN